MSDLYECLSCDKRYVGYSSDEECPTCRDERFTAELETIVPVGTEAVVCSIVAQRQRLGVAKYGTTVADNPLALRQWLQHALEECLDQAVYLRRAIEEIDRG